MTVPSEMRDMAKAEGSGTVELLGLDRQICFPLYAATNMLQRLYRPLLGPLGLTYSQYLVMLVLWDREPVSVSELCDCLYLDVGTLSPLLKRMERGGFICRMRDQDDERRVLISLTVHGREVRKNALHIPDTLARQTGMKPEEFEALRDKVRAFMEQLADAVD